MKKGPLYIVGATLLFSSMEVALKFVAGDFNPIQLTFSRFFVGGAVLLPLALRELKKRGAQLTSRDLGAFALLGLLGVAVSMSLYQVAVIRVPASVVSVLFSSNPLFVTLLAYFLLREAITKNQVAGLALDVAGIVLIIRPWNLSLDAAGVVCVLGATLCFALYGVCGKRKCVDFGGVVVTCFGFLFGAVEMMLLSALTHLGPVSGALRGAGLELFANIPFFTGYSLAALPVILYVFIGVTGAGYTCYFLAMEYTSAQTASLIFFFKPILAPVLACLVLGETVSGAMLGGIGLILCGCLVSLLPGLLRGRREVRAREGI